MLSRARLCSARHRRFRHRRSRRSTPFHCGFTVVSPSFHCRSTVVPPSFHRRFAVTSPSLHRHFAASCARRSHSTCNLYRRWSRARPGGPQTHNTRRARPEQRRTLDEAVVVVVRARSANRALSITAKSSAFRQIASATSAARRYTKRP